MEFTYYAHNYITLMSWGINKVKSPVFHSQFHMNKPLEMVLYILYIFHILKWFITLDLY